MHSKSAFFLGYFSLILIDKLVCWCYNTNTGETTFLVVLDPSVLPTMSI